jgi:hypothetical protein
MPFVINADGDQVWEDWGQRPYIPNYGVPINVAGVPYLQQASGQWLGANGHIVDNSELSRAIQGGYEPSQT